MERECECGCGERFVPSREWHRFYSMKCRSRAWRKRHPILTREEKEVLDRLREKIDGR